MLQVHYGYISDTIAVWQRAGTIDLDFKQLRNFIHIVELSSITAASDALGIAQPALSRQVKALEDELGVALLRRHGRGVSPTEEGLRLAKRAKGILEDVEDLASDLSGTRIDPSGTITLGLPPTVAEILATHLIERAMDAYPQVNLRIASGFSGHVQDWLLRGKIDLGVAYEGQIAPSIRTRPVILENLFVIRPAGCSAREMTAQEALSLPLVLPNAEHGLRGRIERFAASEGVALNVVLEIDVLPTILAFVERGVGATILPLVSVLSQVRDGSLVACPIASPGLDRRLILMSPLNRPGSRLSDIFSDFIVQEVHSLVVAQDWPGTTL